LSRFDGKTVLVTGGASRIGEQTLRRLFDEGASLAVADLHQEDLDRVASKFADTDRLLTVATNVAHRDQVAAFVNAAVERFGTPNGLVNCAGIIAGVRAGISREARTRAPGPAASTPRQRGPRLARANGDT
jgi:meso-butanediol dehydrogenase / (S,S)-butanediol dehydrogenase / diacetyl reductase